MLRKGNPDPLVESNTATAASLGINEGDWAWIETGADMITMRAKLFGGIAPDVVSTQHGWWFPEQSAPEYGRSTLCRIYPVAERQQN